MTQFIPEEIEILKQYISHPTENVFAVFPKLQGIVGAAYARYSRAQGGFREVFLKEFLKEGIVDQTRAQELIERVLIAFGDDSVGELEGAWLSLEEISNLATKEIEDRRIGGSPIEQSTRYVLYDQKYQGKDGVGKFRYLRVPEIMESGLAGKFEDRMNFIFDTYVGLITPMQDYLKRLKPLEEASYDIRGNKQPVKLAELTNDAEIKAFRITYNMDIRTKACDTLRVLLPACTKTNVGLFGNGRFYQTMLTRLYSHNLREMQDLGTKAHQALNSVIPVYVKRAKRDEYLVDTEQNLQSFVEAFLAQFPPRESEDVELLERESFFWVEVLATMLYRYAEHPMSQLRDLIRNSSSDFNNKLFELYIGRRKNKRDRPGRALEVGYPIAFDCVADFGIFRDLHRERMKTQIRQMLTTRLGYVVPDEFEAIGEDQTLVNCYQRSAELYEDIRKELGREVAQYVVLFGHKIRWYQGENFREALHEIELRTIPQGHPSYRKVCQKMCRLLEQRDPFLAKMFTFVDYQDYFWSRAESEAKQRARETKYAVSKLASGSGS